MKQNYRLAGYKTLLLAVYKTFRFVEGMNTQAFQFSLD